MNIERQIIGSLLIDQSRIEAMHGINSDMFEDRTLGDIFYLYASADGKEINQDVLIHRISSSVLSENHAQQLLADLVTEHDSGISDQYLSKAIFDSYRARELNKLIGKTEVNPRNIDKVIKDFLDSLDGLREVEEDAEPKNFSEMASAYENQYFKTKDQKTVFIGFDKLDNAIGGLDGGDTIILAARPSVGKSALALQIIRKFGRDGFKVGYFNLEMAEKQIYERAIASASGIDMSRIRLANCFLNDEKSKFESGNETLKKETNVYTITNSTTIRKIRQKVKKYGFQIIVIDYLQLIQPDVKRNIPRATEVGEISRGLKAIAGEFHIPVIALSQLNRLSEMNKDKEPMMSELKESGDIEQDASVILMMWNPNRDDPSEKMIKVEKSRNGATDRMKLYFDGKHMTFSSIDVNEGFKKAQEGELPWN